jgi:hypothetical protein
MCKQEDGTERPHKFCVSRSQNHKSGHRLSHLTYVTHRRGCEKPPSWSEFIERPNRRRFDQSYCKKRPVLAVLERSGLWWERSPRHAPGLCDSGRLSLRVDHRPIQSWPKSESMKIDGLSTTGRHRVVVYRAEKAQQSFTFRFSDFKSPKPCLFLNDLYWTAQLWGSHQAPSPRPRWLLDERRAQYTFRAEGSIQELDRQTLSRIAGEQYRGDGIPSELHKLGFRLTPHGPLDPSAVRTFERLRVIGIAKLDGCASHVKNCSCIEGLPGIVANPERFRG